jgi:hypothetical protein
LDLITLGIGVLAIGFGLYSAFLRATNPAKLGKLAPMQKAMGNTAGALVHFAAYSLVPIAFGVLTILRGMRGESLF